MATGYGGDIELKVDLDVSPAKKSASSLRSIIDKALGSGDTRVRSMGLQLQKATDKMNNLQAKMKEMENTKVPTEKYTQLQNELKTLESQISKVTSDMQKMQDAGTHQQYSSEYSKLLEDQKWLLEQIQPLQEKYEQNKATGFTDDQMSGMDWYKEYQALSAELSDVQGEMQALIDLGEQYSSTAEFQAKQEELDALQAKYADTEQSVQALKDANADYMSQAEADPAAYNKVATDADNAATSVGILQQKIQGAMSKTQSLRDAWTSFKNVASGAISSISKSLKSTFSNALSKIKGNHNTSFKSMLTTVLKYGFGIRSIYFLFNKVRNTIKTGLSEMSKDFSDVSDDVYSLKNSWSGFKASLVSAFQPIFSYVVPALTTLINYLTSAMNALANFFAMLTGSSTYYKAVKGNESVAESVGSTGSAAEEATEALADYDDLIVIDQDSSSGGSGGGSGSGSSDAWNWEEVAVESNSWIDKIKSAFTDWDFTEIGSELGTKLTNMLLSIPWDTVYEGASNFGKGLATFLNGLISEDLFSAVGSTIAKSLNTALHFLNTFGTTFEWTEFGNSIAAGINAFVEDFDLDLAVDTFNAWANGILDTLIAAVQGVSWDKMGQKIADGIAKIDAKGIGWRLGTLVDSLIDAIYDLVSVKSTWENLGQKLADGINGFFEGFDGSDLADTVDAIVEGLKTFLGTTIRETDWGLIAEDIIAMIGDLDLGTIGLIIGGFTLGTKTGRTILSMVLQQLAAKLGISSMAASLPATLGGIALKVAAVTIAAAAAFKIGWEFGTTAGEFVAEWMKNKGIITGEANDGYYEIAESMSMTEKIKDIKLSVEEGTFADAWTNMWGDWFDPTFAEIEQLGVTIKSVALEFVEGWNDFNDSVWDPVFELGEDIWEGIKEGFVDMVKRAIFPENVVFDWFVENIKTLFGINSPAEEMKPYGGYIFEGLIEGFKDKFTSIKNSVSELYSTFKAKLTEKFKNFKITDLFSNVGNMAVTLTTTLAGTLTSLVDFESLSTFFSNVKQKWKNLKSTIKTTLSGAFNKISGTTGSTLQNLSNTWNTLKESWTDKEATLTGKLSGVFGTVSTGIDTVRTKFENLKTAWADDEATLKAKVGGQINSIGEMIGNSDSWASKFTNFVQNIWQDDTATLKANAEVGGTSDNSLSNFVNGGGWYNKFTSFTKLWGTTYTSTMKAEANVGGSTDNTLSNLSENTGSTWRKKFTDFVGLWSSTATATFNAKYVDADTNSAGYQAYCNLWNNWQNKTATFTVAYDANAQEGLTTMANTVLRRIYDAMDSSGIKIKQKVWAARGGIVNYPVYAGEAGQEAIIPLERNLGWMDKMATAISGKIMDMSIPGIATGQVLPANSDFYKSSTESDNKVVELLEDMIRTFSSNNVENKEPIVIQVDGRQMAQIVWDETDKRYKQLGRAY